MKTLNEFENYLKTTYTWVHGKMGWVYLRHHLIETLKEISWRPCQTCVRQQVTENDFQRRLNFCYWFVCIGQNSRFLPIVVVGDEACFSIDGTVNTCNVRMCKPKRGKPDFKFERNINTKQLPSGVECVAKVDKPDFKFERNIHAKKLPSGVEFVAMVLY